jgi:RNA polymerase sigma-70 factor (ECF subfamily)
MKDTSSDEQLVREAINGNENAFSQIYERYRLLVYLTAYRVIRNAVETQDATQEIFIKVHRSLSQWDPKRAQFHSWLRRIALNHAIDFWRARRKDDKQLKTFQSEIPEQLSAPCSPQRKLELRERVQEIRRIVSKLPKLQMRIFQLYYFQNYKLKDISEKELRSLGTIKVNLFRSTRSVRRRLCAHTEFRRAV